MIESTMKISLALLVVFATIASAEESPKTGSKIMHLLNQVQSKFPSLSSARQYGGGYDDGGDDGGLGLLLPLAALLLSGLALLAALAGPALTLGLTGLTGTGVAGQVTGGTVGVLPGAGGVAGVVGRRRRRDILHEDSLGGVENVLAMLDKAVKMYDHLAPLDKKSIVCDMAKGGPITDGLAAVTKKFAAAYEFLKDYEPGSVMDSLKKSSAANVLASIFETCDS